MDEAAFDMIVASTRARGLVKVFNKGDENGGMDMCQALTEMLQDERNEGRIEGREEGREEGMLLTSKIFKSVRMGNADEETAKLCECTLEEVLHVRKIFEI